MIPTIDQTLTAPPVTVPARTIGSRSAFNTAVTDELDWRRTNIEEMEATRTQLNATVAATNAAVEEIDAAVLVVTDAKTGAETAQGLAEDARDVSAAAAITAVAAANTAALGASNATGTSVTSLAIGSGSKTLTTQTAKGWLPGMTVKVFYDVSNYMIGTVTAYDSGAGSLTFNCTLPVGSGTYADWDITLTVAPGGITTVTVATTSVTLTSTPTLLQFTPTTYGQRITLPDATTMAEGGPAHCLDIRGPYPALVDDFDGNLLGFVSAGTHPVYLDDNASTAGVWGVVAMEKIGTSMVIESGTTGIGTLAGVLEDGRSSIDMGNGFEILVGIRPTDGYLLALAVNRNTGEYGAQAVIRAAAVSSGSYYTGAQHSSTQALMVSTAGAATSLEAVIVSLDTGTLALTVHTAATATLSANNSGFFTSGMVGVPSAADSFVIGYEVATPATQIRAISVSGTTVAIGSAEVLDGTYGANPSVLQPTADKVIAVSFTYSTQTVYVKPYTVSGSTLSPGTGANTTYGGSTSTPSVSCAPWGAYWFLSCHNSSAYGNVLAAIITLSGTTTTLSTATVEASSNLLDAVVVSATKALVITNPSGSTNCNVVTNTGGTISVGAAKVIRDSNSSAACHCVVGTEVLVGFSISSISYTATVDASGTDPVISQGFEVAAGSTANLIPSLGGRRNGKQVPSGNYLLSDNYVGTLRGNYGLGAIATAESNLTTVLPAVNAAAHNATRGSSNKRIWAYYGNTSGGYRLSLIEAA